MSLEKYTMDSTLGELLEESAALEIFNQAAPGIIDTPAMGFMKIAPLNQLIASAPEKKEMFQVLLDAANGKEVSYIPVDSKNVLPKIDFRGNDTYDIDDVDGRMFMLEHRFTGCLIARFSKTMDERIYGKITCDGEELPKGLIKSIVNAGGIQMFGIPVRDTFKEYDTEYKLHIEGFVDTDGNMMEPQDVTIRTLPKPAIDTTYAKHDEVALQAAREGIVLLKNENDILPLAADCKIYVEGASKFRIGAVGAGRINPRYSMNLNRALEECSEFVLTESGDTCVIVISRASGENFDNNPIKGEFYLTDAEEERIKDLSNRYKHLVAVISSGYPMDLRWTKKYGIQGVLWCGFAGMLAGKAVVEILDGRVNPSGKLPDTWSLDYFDIPSSANFYHAKDAESALSADSPYFVDTYYEEDIYVGYRYFETFNKPVAYSFGFGLSYTKFTITATYEEKKITGAVVNKGTRSGKEVVQIYVQIPDGKLEQPTKRLVGFIKTPTLKSEERYEFSLDINKENLTSFDTQQAAWIVEKGSYEFYVGNAINHIEKCGTMVVSKSKIIRQVENLMKPPVEISSLSKNQTNMPSGVHSGVKETVTRLEPIGKRKSYKEQNTKPHDFVSKLSVEELARLSVCASHGWGMHEKGEAGRIYRLDGYDIPAYVVADGNNGVNVNKPNIGMPCSNTVCATWNPGLAYEVGRVIAEEAKENEIDMILAPAMNIHRNPLNGRHPEYFSEDPYLAGIMAGHQSKGLEEQGVSSCIKHTIANNCEASRKRNHSIMTERALREIYLKVFEVAMSVHQPDSMMTGYNACNGCYTATDEEMIQGIFRNEFGFEGFVMTDWGSYDTIDIASAIQAGNGWMTPGSTDDTYVTPIVEGVKSGKIDLERLRANIRYMLRVVQKRKGQDLGVK